MLPYKSRSRSCEKRLIASGIRIQIVRFTFCPFEFNPNKSSTISHRRRWDISANSYFSCDYLRSRRLEAVFCSLEFHFLKFFTAWWWIAMQLIRHHQIKIFDWLWFVRTNSWLVVRNGMQKWWRIARYRFLAIANWVSCVHTNHRDRWIFADQVSYVFVYELCIYDCKCKNNNTRRTETVGGTQQKNRDSSILYGCIR